MFNLFRKKRKDPAQPQKMDFSKYKLKLNIRTICYYEHFTGKNFFKMTEADFFYLLYSMFVTATDMPVTYKEFEFMVEQNEKIAKWLIKGYKEETQKATMSLALTKSIMDEVNEEQEDKEEESMTQLVSRLIIKHGMSPDYVYDRMEIWEIPNYYLAADAVTKETYEKDRLWTYMIDIPHMNPKKAPKTPEDFMPFPWEKETKKERKIKDINKNRDAILKMLGSNLFQKEKEETEDGGV